jgi:hypothetical protein
VSPVLEEFPVAPGTYQVSPEPMRLVATLFGALALCLHDERRGVGGLLHLPFLGASGRSGDATDHALGEVLVVLDRFKRAVLGDAVGRDDVQARILAHALPPLSGEAMPPLSGEAMPLLSGEAIDSLVDLIKADLVDARIVCGSEIYRRVEPVRVCFEPLAGRMWVRAPMGRSGLQGRRSAA